jgi:hypothetical protein
MTHTTIQKKVMKTKPTKATGLSEEGIGEAIKEGAGTKQYLADPKTIVSALNRLRLTEITSTCNTNNLRIWRSRSYPLA